MGTYAPQDLLDALAYLRSRGAPLDALGIVGDSAHAATGGYHEGRVDLVTVGRLGYDYSVVESPRDAHPTDAASALDFAGTAWWRPLTLWLVDQCKAGAPGTGDIREIIYTPDGQTVRRWDRLGVRSTGDDSHLWHTHLSFFRDSEGRRGSFLALLRSFFEPATGDEEDDMFALTLAIPHRVPVWGKDDAGNDVVTGYRWPEQWPGGYVSHTVPTVNQGIVPWGAAWLSVCNDTFGRKYAVRVAGGNGGAHVYADPWTLGSLQRNYTTLADGTAFVSFTRVPVDANDLMTDPVSACIEYARR